MKEAPFKLIRKELELLTDINKILFYEKGVRGRITRLIFHYAEANNKYMYDNDKTKKVHAF